MFFIVLLIIPAMFIFIVIFHFAQRAIGASRIRKVNDALLPKLKKMMSVEKILYLANRNSGDDNTAKQIIVVSTSQKKVGFIDYEREKVFVVDFKDVLGYEIYENDNALTEGFGVGKVKNNGKFSMYTSQTTEQICKNLTYIIKLKCLECTQVTYEIIERRLIGFVVRKNGGLYADCMRSIQMTSSIIDAIKNQD